MARRCLLNLPRVAPGGCLLEVRSHGERVVSSYDGLSSRCLLCPDAHEPACFVYPVGLGSLVSRRALLCRTVKYSTVLYCARL